MIIHTLPLSYFRQENFFACARKNYSTVVIHLRGGGGGGGYFC